MSFYLCIFYEANTFENATEETDLDTLKLATEAFWCQSLQLAQLSCWLLLCSFQFSEFFVDEVNEGYSLQSDIQLFTQGPIYSCGSKPKQQQPSDAQKNKTENTHKYLLLANS